MKRLILIMCISVFVTACSSVDEISDYERVERFKASYGEDESSVVTEYRQQRERQIETASGRFRAYSQEGNMGYSLSH